MIEPLKEVLFNGTLFYLMGTRKYYLSQSFRNQKRDSKNPHPKGLHVAIYEHFTGKRVKKGYVVHHLDGDPLNNSIENLICLSRVEHKRIHDMPMQMRLL